jgi:hypothetical protein
MSWAAAPIIQHHNPLTEWWLKVLRGLPPGGFPNYPSLLSQRAADAAYPLELSHVEYSDFR